MTMKPQLAASYDRDFTTLVRGACLTIATRLGDLIDDCMIVGGLVPSLLLDQSGIPDHGRHIGTRDVDIGLSLKVLDGERYTAIAERLRGAGFVPDTNPDSGNPTPQRWISPATRITIDFLIGPGEAPNDQPARVWKLQQDLGAFIIPGIEAAFGDAELVHLEGVTLDDVQAACDIRVCGPGAFVVLKALAFGIRREPKDAYDLHFMLTNHPDGLEDIARRIRGLQDQALVTRALAYLAADYETTEHFGPQYAARFVQRDTDAAYLADVKGAMDELRRLLQGCDET